MYEKHPVFKTPPRTCPIWRYMSFASFVWLIAEESLFFSRLDQHEDQWEGMLPSNIDFERRQYIRFNRFINCWHMNSIESDAMWKLYGSTTGETVAIRSTVGDLIGALARSHIPVYIGKIEYEEGDIPNDGSLYLPVIYKRRPFQHEKELRLCITSERNPNPPDLTPLKQALSALCVEYKSNMEILKAIGDKGIPVSVDLDRLIHEVVICPNSKPYLKDSVHYIMSDKLQPEKIRNSYI